MDNDIFNIAGKLINEINDIKDNTEKKKEIKKEFIERAQNYRTISSLSHMFITFPPSGNTWRLVRHSF